MYITADSAAAKPVDNGVPAATAAAAKKKEKVSLRKKESKVIFAHPWLACNLKGHSGPVLGLDFSPNGKYLASCSEGSFFIESLLFTFCRAVFNIFRAAEIND